MSDLTARIAGLWRYPVKSCAGEAVDSLQLGDDGWPEGDRSWGVINADGELTWMGAFHRLALVRARLTPTGLALEAAGQVLELPNPSAAVAARGWNGNGFDELEAWDAGDAAAALLHATTGERLRLVRLGIASQRRPFLNALHVVSDASLQAWQEALPQAFAGFRERVRPNVLLAAVDDGELPPFIEDLVNEARIGGLVLRRTGPCERCLMTTVDPTTAEPQPPVLQALAQLSAERAPGSAVHFGIYVQGAGAGTLRVGDRVDLGLNFG